jgi:3'-5' exonuclease
MIRLHEILFLDIETVPAAPDWTGLEPSWQRLWEEKSRIFRERQQLELEESYGRAGIYAEFGKIICIGVGYFNQTPEGEELRVTSFSGDDEESMLREFGAFLDRVTRKPFRYLCAHNGKEFDFPYICRRMLACGIPLPRLLRIAGLKPWEVPHLDTMELWKFGDFKHYTSLRLLAGVFGIPDSKEDMDGSMVASVYWTDRDLGRIREYCRRDVSVLARVYQRLQGLEAIPEEAVIQVG